MQTLLATVNIENIDVLIANFPSGLSADLAFFSSATGSSKWWASASCTDLCNGHPLHDPYGIHDFIWKLEMIEPGLIEILRSKNTLLFLTRVYSSRKEQKDKEDNNDNDYDIIFTHDLLPIILDMLTY